MRCSSLEMCRKNFRISTPLRARWRSNARMLLKRSSQMSLPTSGLRQVLARQDFRMHAHHQHFLVVRAVEDADAPALGQRLGDAPEEIVIEFLARSAP